MSPSRDPRLVASVVVPTYRRPALLRECIEAVLAQLEEGDELVVCDDGSGDDTLEVLESVGDERLRWVTQPNAGPAGARNTAVAACRNELLVFVDDDEPPLPGWLRAHRSAHDPDRRMMVMGRRELLVPHRGGHKVIAASLPSLDGLIPNQGSFSLRRAVLSEVAPFREELRRAEEMELFFRLRAAGVEFVPAPDAVTRHSIDRSFEEFYADRLNNGKGSATLRHLHGIGLYPPVASMRRVDRVLTRAALSSESAGRLIARVLWGGVRVAGWIGSWQLQARLAGRISVMLGASAEQRALQGRSAS